MSAYSDGWQLPAADDVTDVERDRWEWIVANDRFAEVPHADGIRSGKPASVVDVAAVAGNGVRRPLVTRSVSGGVWVVDDETGQLSCVEAPTVRYSAESGTAAGWGGGAVETSPVVLSRSASRVTRSRKGRSSFKVTRRHQHRVTVGDRSATGCDWQLPEGRFTGQQLATFAEAYVRAFAWQNDIEVEPLPRLVGADDGRQLTKPGKVDLADVADVVASDIEVDVERVSWQYVIERGPDIERDGEKLPGRIVRAGWRRAAVEVERRPYLLSTSDSRMHCPGVTAQHQTLAGIDDDAAWRGHEGNGIADAYRQRRLATRIPRRIAERTQVLADIETETGQRRLIRGQLAADGSWQLVAPGVGGWWIGHTFHSDTSSKAIERAATAANVAPVRDRRAAIDGWLPLAVALGVGSVVDVDGATLARPTVERFEVRTAAGTYGGRTAAAAITKAKRALAPMPR